MSRTQGYQCDLGYGKPMPWVDLFGGPSLAELDPARWHPNAACSGEAAGGWFAEGRDLRVRNLKRMCAECPVRRTCLASSLVYAEEYGIWGGLTAARRKPLLRALASGQRLGDVLDSALDAGQPRDVA